MAFKKKYTPWNKGKKMWPNGRPDIRGQRKFRCEKHGVAYRKHRARAGGYCPQCSCEQQRRLRHRRPEYFMWFTARRSAKKCGVPFAITPQDILIPMNCPVFGFGLIIGTGHAQPNSPSLDRIRPELGYVAGNVQVISHKANTMKSNATLEELQSLVSYLRTKL
jgi:hypothetical protein